MTDGTSSGDAPGSDERGASDVSPRDAPEAPDQVLEGILEDADPKERKKLLRMALAMEQYRSPHPHPDHLERYAKLYPDAPRIIFESFEKQGQHRRDMEDRFLTGSERRANIGQWLAFVLVLAVILSGVYAISMGEATAGSLVISAGLAGGVLLVIAGVRPERKTAVRRAEQSERDSARAEVSEPDGK